MSHGSFLLCQRKTLWKGLFISRNVEKKSKTSSLAPSNRQLFINSDVALQRAICIGLQHHPFSFVPHSILFNYSEELDFKVDAFCWAFYWNLAYACEIQHENTESENLALHTDYPKFVDYEGIRLMLVVTVLLIFVNA